MARIRFGCATGFGVDCANLQDGLRYPIRFLLTEMQHLLHPVAMVTMDDDIALTRQVSRRDFLA
jgi:hypothetical protein